MSNVGEVRWVDFLGTAFKFRKKKKTIVLDFSWDDCNAQKKLETTVTQNFRG